MTDRQSSTPSDTIESVWLVEATCAPDATEARIPFRARHLARIAELKEAGVIIEAGAYLDVTASLILLRAADEGAALEIVRGDGAAVALRHFVPPT